IHIYHACRIHVKLYVHKEATMVKKISIVFTKLAYHYEMSTVVSILNGRLSSLNEKLRSSFQTEREKLTFVWRFSCSRTCENICQKRAYFVLFTVVFLFAQE